MQVLLPFLFLLSVRPVRSIFDGTCPRKEPPPGMLVLSPGSKLVLTCSGHVKVDGEKVSVTRNNSSTRRRWSSSVTANITNNTGDLIKSDKKTVKNVTGGYHTNPNEEEENNIITHTDKRYIPSPTTHMVQPSSVSRPQEGESQWNAEEVDGEGDSENEEGEEGSRVTRGIKLIYQWKMNGRTVGNGDTDWGEINFEGRGATLSLSSVRATDSGKYACYYKGREKFTLRVTVAEPPETPTLSCYKRSPSIKGKDAGPFRRFNCSYSSRLSRCWCALDYNEDELGTLHKAYLCVTSITGNATSRLLPFRPLGILKPDPPSHVSVRQVVGQETRLKVTWSLPSTWKSQNSFYELIYELRYRPLKSSIYEQVRRIKEDRFYIITDAIMGVEYMVQLRASEEYDGLWSDWSTPVNGTSWTALSVSPLITTTFPTYTEGSGAEDDFADVIEPVFSRPEMSHQILWIAGSFALLSATLAAYIFRHKDRFLSKLQSLNFVTQSGDSPQPLPSAPTAPEGQALVTFAPPCYKDAPSSEVGEAGEENEEEQQVNERVQALHFNNTSYFFLE